MSPVRLQIPAAWVDARIQTVGITPEGEMGAPDDFWEVGWYRYGARPGDTGKAVMAGHLDSQHGAAVFYHIGDLEPGDEIRVLLGGPDGERFYRVREIAQYHVDDAPLDKIFGPSDDPELVLITCGGEWRGADAGGYTDRIVVYADMVMPEETADSEPAADDPRS
jgi:sortase A